MKTRDYVGHTECLKIRSLYDDGWSNVEIAAELDRCLTTVIYHKLGYCRHEPDAPSDDELATELAAVADRCGCIPRKRDWNEYATYDRTASTLENRFGSWGEALAAADLPVVVDAPQKILEAAYEKPSLTGHDRATEVVE